MKKLNLLFLKNLRNKINLIESLYLSKESGFKWGIRLKTIEIRDKAFIRNFSKNEK
jgi:hypothetical protein